jgi:hypothetical protein
MAQFSFIDIISVAVIILSAMLWLSRTYMRVRKNHCSGLCNGCNSNNSCGSKSFATVSKKTIPIYSKN